MPWCRGFVGHMFFPCISSFAGEAAPEKDVPFAILPEKAIGLMVNIAA